MGRNQPAQLSQPYEFVQPTQQSVLSPGQHQPLEYRGHLQPGRFTAHQAIGSGLPTGFPTEGVETQVSLEGAEPGLKRIPQQLRQCRNLQWFRSQIRGKQHQPCPTATAGLCRIGEGFITPFTGMEQQRRGIEIEQCRGFSTDAHQGVGHQQSS